jgi:hypothetical protein
MMNAKMECMPCSAGKYRLGWHLKANPDNKELDCPDGLATTFLGAKSKQQCFTTPGYGRVVTQLANGTVSMSGVLCPVGTYNMGSNTAGCLAPPALTASPLPKWAAPVQLHALLQPGVITSSQATGQW